MVRNVAVVLIYGFGLLMVLVAVVAVIGVVDFRHSP